MKRKNGKFIFIAVLLVLITSLIIIYKDKIPSNVTGIFQSSSDESTILYKGSNESNIVGKINYKGTDYKYAGSFTESYVNINVNESLKSKDAVKKVSSGLIGIDYNNTPISLRIDFTDEYNESKGQNIRNYTIVVEYKDIKKTVQEKVTYKNYILNPIYGLNFENIIIESGVWK